MTVHGKTTPLVTKAIIAQQRLGGEFLLRGYLSKDWVTAMAHHADDKPDQRMSHLLVGLWKHIFEAAWGKRNELSNSTSSITAKYECQQLTSELHEWKRSGGALLGHRQIYLIDYTHEEISQWTLPTLQMTIKMITKAAQNFIEHQDNASQTYVTDYFIPITYGNDGDYDHG